MDLEVVLPPLALEGYLTAQMRVVGRSDGGREGHVGSCAPGGVGRRGADVRDSGMGDGDRGGAAEQGAVLTLVLGVDQALGKLGGAAQVVTAAAGGAGVVGGTRDWGEGTEVAVVVAGAGRED